jgi:NAD+ synthase
MTELTRFTVTLAQLNPIVGDITGNAAKARAARAQAKADGATLIVFPELFIAGYPPEDLVLKPAFQAACRAAIEELARETADGGPAVLIGSPWVDGGKLYNACALLDDGRISAIRFKVNLPNYGVFDEKRVFARGSVSGPVTIRGLRVGVPICEDTWMEESADYEDVVETLTETGAEILIVPNGSPYARGKTDLRLSVQVARVTESHLPMVYLNQVGGQDELVFDGASFVLNADRSLGAQLPSFTESITTLTFEKRSTATGAATDRSHRYRKATRPTTPPACWACATTSTRTASRMCSCWASPAVSIPRFAPRSPSMRSARSACAASCCPIATPRRIRSTMPRSCAKALGCRYEIVPIAEPVKGFEQPCRYVRGHRIRHHRRKPAEPHARHAPDGALQQVRLDGGHHRQQVGNVGRLCHALRRHEWRLQSDQGPLQDPGLSAVALAQFMEAAGRARSDRAK